MLILENESGDITCSTLIKSSRYRPCKIKTISDVHILTLVGDGVPSSTLTITGLQFIGPGGNGPTSGMHIYNLGQALEIVYCTFEGGSFQYATGGGITDMVGGGAIYIARSQQTCCGGSSDPVRNVASATHIYGSYFHTDNKDTNNRATDDIKRAGGSTLANTVTVHGCPTNDLPLQTSLSLDPLWAVSEASATNGAAISGDLESYFCVAASDVVSCEAGQVSTLFLSFEFLSFQCFGVHMTLIWTVPE